MSCGPREPLGAAVPLEDGRDLGDVMQRVEVFRPVARGLFERALETEDVGRYRVRQTEEAARVQTPQIVARLL